MLTQFQDASNTFINSQEIKNCTQTKFQLTRIPHYKEEQRNITRPNTENYSSTTNSEITGLRNFIPSTLRILLFHHHQLPPLNISFRPNSVHLFNILPKRRPFLYRYEWYNLCGCSLSFFNK